MSAIDCFFREIARFCEQLSIAVYICASQLSCGPELMNIRHCNSEWKCCNIFIEDYIVIIVSQYYKGFYIYNDTKIIFWYLLREISELVV